MAANGNLPKVLHLPVDQLPPHWRRYELVTGNRLLNKWVLR